MKIKEFQKYMRENGINLTIFTTRKNKVDFNLIYFAGTDCPRGALVIPKTGEPVLYVSNLEYGSVKARVKIKVMDKRLSEIINKKNMTIGINKDITTLNEYKMLKKGFSDSKFVDISGICRELRETKTDEEIMIMKKACSITDKIMQKLISNFKKFKSEDEIFNFIAEETKKAGCTQSWDPVVASGKNAAVPHYFKKGKINKGFCIIDMGVVYKGYNSDMTRTFYIGNPTKKEIDVYNLVLETQKRLIKNLHAGKIIEEIDKEAREMLGNHAKYFVHLPGHGIGTKVWEFPQMLPNSKKRLKENSVITIEPGVYIPNKLGIRIEDDVLITKKGAVVLTKTPKELLII